MRRSHKKLWVSAAFAFLLFGGVAVARLLPALGTERYIRDLQVAGFPVTPRDLNSWYKPLPAAENPALPVLAASKLIVRAAPIDDPFGEQSKLPSAGEPVSASVRALIHKQLASNAPALKLLHQLPGGRGRYPIDLSMGAYTLLPHLAEIKSGARLLRSEALERALASDPEGATASLLPIFDIAETLCDEPLIISQMVRIAILAIALDAMERVLSAASFTDPQLVRLLEAVESAEQGSRDCLQRAFIGERAIGLTIFDLSAKDASAFWGGGTPAPGSTSNFEDILKETVWSLHRSLGFRARDKARYLQIMGLYAAGTAPDFPEKMRHWQTATDEMNNFMNSRTSFLYPLTRLLVPTFEGSTRKEAFLVGQLRCARIAIALERYRAAHGGVKPRDLEQLLPNYLATIPDDPFDGSALQLELLGTGGFVIRAPTASLEKAKGPTSSAGPKTVAFSITR